MWRLTIYLFVFGCSVLVAGKCPNVPQGTAKLLCYYEGRKSLENVDPCGCTHLIYTGSDRGESLNNISKVLLEKKPKLKILLRITGKDKDMVDLIKSSTIHGVEFFEAHSALNRTKILKTTESIRSAIGSEAAMVMSLPAHSELLAKYYDLKSLTKSISMFTLETQALGEVENETFHPSRLSGVWDMLNTDSVVDLVIGLGVPVAKIVINSPAKAYKFMLKNTTLSTPGSPASEKLPMALNQKELCSELSNGEKWTLERDQDLSAPYAFKDAKWIAFEDASSLDVKGKYSRIRGLAGMGIFAIDDDFETDCGPSLLQSILKAFGSQSRAPRGAVLSSLENEILSVPLSSRHVDAVQLSPYRISRVVDSDGVIHAIREDTRTEFECQRQGYFVHPRTCNRFYRCVKFDQLSDEFTVFEFDCPAGLAFDSRWEVCVWPGSLSHGQACPGSSEIAPVPKSRFVCPEKPGYYADPGNCRWFFACLDHGKSPFSAYEFRCPFGLGFDASRLICDWPWLVPGCGNLGKYEASAYGHGSHGSILTGSSAYIGSSADSVNVAGHNSLISGASATNLVGIQSGYGSHQGYESGYKGELNKGYDGNAGNYYESQSSNLHGGEALHGLNTAGSVSSQDSGKLLISGGYGASSNQYNSGYNVKNSLNGNYANGQISLDVNSGAYVPDNSGDYREEYAGAYNHDSSGEYRHMDVPYKHVQSGSPPYVHSESNSDYKDQYGGSYQTGSDYNLNSANFNSGHYSGATGSGVAHTLTAGAINSGLVGKTTLIDADSSRGQYYQNQGVGYDGHTGKNNYAYSNQNLGIANNNYNQRIDYSANGYNSGKQAYISQSTIAPINNQAVYVNPTSQQYVVSPPKSSVSQVFGVQKQSVSYVQPIVTVSSTPKPYIRYEQQPQVSITNYKNQPSVVAVTQAPFAHEYHSSTPQIPIVYKKAPVTVYSNPLIPVKNVTPVPTVSFVPQPTYSAYYQSTTPTFNAQPYKHESGYVYQNNAKQTNTDGGYVYKAPEYLPPNAEYKIPSVVIDAQKANSYSNSYIKHEPQKYVVNQPTYVSSTLSPINYESSHKANYANSVSNSYIKHEPQVHVVSQPTYVSSTPASINYNQHNANYANSVSHSVSNSYVKHEPQKYVVSQPTSSPINYDTSHQANYANSYIKQEPQVHVVNQPTPASINYNYQQSSGHKTNYANSVSSSYVKHEPTYVSSTPASINYDYEQSSGYKANSNIYVKHEPQQVHVVSQPAYVSSTPASINYNSGHKANYANSVSSSISNSYVKHEPQVHVVSQPAYVSSTPASINYDYEQSSGQKANYAHSVSNSYVKHEPQQVHVVSQPAYVSSTPASINYNYQQSLGHKTNSVSSSISNSYVKHEPQVHVVSQPAYVSSTPASLTYDYEQSSGQKANYANSVSSSISNSYVKHEPQVHAVSQPAYVSSTPASINYNYEQSSGHKSNYVNSVSNSYIKHEPQVQHTYVSSTPASINYDYKQSLGQKANYANSVSSSISNSYVKHEPQVHVVSQPTYVSSTPSINYDYKQSSGQKSNYANSVSSSISNSYVKHEPQVHVVSQPAYVSSTPSINYDYKQSSGHKSNYVNSVSNSYIKHEPQVQHTYVSSTPASINYDYDQSSGRETNYANSDSSYVSNSYIKHEPQVHVVSQPVYASSTPASINYNYQQSSGHKANYANSDSSYVSNSYIKHEPQVQIVSKPAYASSTPAYTGHKANYANSVSSVSNSYVKHEPQFISQPAYVSSSVKPIISSTHASIEYKQPLVHTNYYEQSVPEYTSIKYVQPTTPATIHFERTFNYQLPKAQSVPHIQVSTPIPFTHSVYDIKKSNLVEQFHISSKPGENSYIYNAPKQQYVNLNVAHVPSTYTPIKYEAPVTQKPIQYTYSVPIKSIQNTPPPYSAIQINNLQETYVPIKTYQSTQAPVTTTYKAPDYLPPLRRVTQKPYQSTTIKYEAPVSVNVNPITEFGYKNVDITPIQTHDYDVRFASERPSNLLGFSTVGPNAGLVEPIIYTSTESVYRQKVLPVQQIKYVSIPQKIIEVTPPSIVRKSRPKIAVVTKVNDFNPLLVRKLGAVCSCRSNVLRLREPNQNKGGETEYDVEYDGDYAVPVNGDNDEEWTYKSDDKPIVYNKPKITVVSSTFKPIIVPDELDYDYKSGLQPIVVNEDDSYSTTETIKIVSSAENPNRGRPLRIRTKVRPVTIAPTIETVLIPKYETPVEFAAIKQVEFDRYGPGGLRGRDETLQGSIDCQRVGLFRHPKHCNKFYSCRWDCTKKKFTLHMFNCPVQLSFDPNMGACNWPSQGPACESNTLLPSGF